MTARFLAASQLDVSRSLWMSWLADLVNPAFSKQTWLTQHEDEVDSDVAAVTVDGAVVVRVVEVARMKKRNGS